MSKKKAQIRKNFRDAVFNRDKHKCKFCDVTTNLDAHHITDRNDMPNGGYVKENGISLCVEHHKEAERWHCSGGTDYANGMTPNDLYKIIGSSHIIAVQKSNKLR